ncbi:hypothetical protein B0H63DRAFT_525866 [Podospora didyma]|uniref:DUF4246 domain-containing protein n=1 Tax=Podospora didyma TaxID=330526 RepID=A0AAE0N8D5_9PEZI|nr:hypothetical protein B0H63DRAFT_525866 [Podospora didyma]
MFNDLCICRPRHSRLIYEQCFERCIKELQEKAAYFHKTGSIVTVNADINIVIKSDVLVNPAIRCNLQAAFGTVQCLVDPSMYPFIYGQSRFFREEASASPTLLRHLLAKAKSSQKTPWSVECFNGGIPNMYWSTEYQWLPANLAF